MPKLLITIPVDGQVTVEGKGFTGHACGTAINQLMKNANATVTTVANKPEFYQTQTTVRPEIHVSQGES